MVVSPTIALSVSLILRAGGLTRDGLTREEYAQTVLSYSQLSVAHSLYAGLHFENLARYLQKSYEARAPDLTATTNDSRIEPIFNFGILYNLDPSAEE